MSIEILQVNQSVASRALKTRTVGDAAAILAARVGAWVSAVGPWERRHVVAGLGAVAALILGGSVAGVFRLPAEIGADAATPDQTVALGELPSEALARANALNNPPVVALKTALVDNPSSLSDQNADISSSVMTTGSDAAQDNGDQGDDDQAARQPAERSQPSSASADVAQNDQ